MPSPLSSLRRFLLPPLATLAAVGVAFLIACSTLPRPDLPNVKQGGKTYEHYQDKVVGITVGKPKLREVPSKMDGFIGIVRKPAKWMLWITLPASIVITVMGVIAVTYMGNPKLAKMCAVLAIALFAAAMLSTAWILATVYVWVFVPLVIIAVGGIIWGIYRITRGVTPSELKRLIEEKNKLQ